MRRSLGVDSPQDPALAFHAIEDIANRRPIEIDDLGQPRGVDAGMRADGDERGVLDGGEIAAAFLGEVRGRRPGARAG